MQKHEKLAEQTRNLSQKEPREKRPTTEDTINQPIGNIFGSSVCWLDRLFETKTIGD